MDRNALNSIPLGAGAPNNLVRSKISQTFQQVSGMSGFVEYAIEIDIPRAHTITLRTTRWTPHQIIGEQQQTTLVMGRQQVPIPGYGVLIHEVSLAGRSNRLLPSGVNQEHSVTSEVLPHVYHTEFGYISTPHTQQTTLAIQQLFACHAYVVENLIGQGETIGSSHIARHGYISGLLQITSEVTSGRYTAVHSGAMQEHVLVSDVVSSAHTAIPIALTNLCQLTDFVVAYDLTQEWAPLPRRVALGKQPRSVAVSSLDTSSGVQ